MNLILRCCLICAFINTAFSLFFSGPIFLKKRKPHCQKYDYRFNNNRVNFVCIDLKERTGRCPKHDMFMGAQWDLSNIACNADKICPIGFKCCHENHDPPYKICKPIEYEVSASIKYQLSTTPKPTLKYHPTTTHASTLKTQLSTTHSTTHKKITTTPSSSSSSKEQLTTTRSSLSHQETTARSSLNYQETTATSSLNGQETSGTSSFDDQLTTELICVECNHTSVLEETTTSVNLHDPQEIVASMDETDLKKSSDSKASDSTSHTNNASNEVHKQVSSSN